MRQKLEALFVAAISGNGLQYLFQNFRAAIVALVEERAQIVGMCQARQEMRDIAQMFQGWEHMRWIMIQSNIDTPISPIVNGTFFGWYDITIQVFMERLPIELNPYGIPRFDGHDLWVVKVPKQDREKWRSCGFADALPMALQDDKTRDGCNQTIVKVLEPAIAAKAGYANACIIQYKYDSDGFQVLRDIPNHGFMKAWTWEPGIRDKYLERQPELFEDSDLWNIRYYPDDVKAAVLGTGNSVNELIGVVYK